MFNKLNMNTKSLKQFRILFLIVFLSISINSKAKDCFSISIPVNIKGTPNNDILTGTSASELIDGGEGLDSVVYSCKESFYKIERLNDLWKISSSSEGVDTLKNIERIIFPGMVVALDINGNSGKIYRLYQAVFGRSPDNEGLKFWINESDNGLSFIEIAKRFCNSQEFKSMYGSSFTNSEFITRLYKNILHRDPDPAGYSWWLSQLNSKAVDVFSLLIYFSESDENKSGVIHKINNGIKLIDLSLIPNTAPVANSGGDRSTMAGKSITLDGSASYDKDDDQITYLWEIKSKPQYSIAQISNPTLSKPSINIDIEGAYTISLVVNDGRANSEISTARITASAPKYCPAKMLYWSRCSAFAPRTLSGNTVYIKDTIFPYRGNATAFCLGTSWMAPAATTGCQY